MPSSTNGGGWGWHIVRLRVSPAPLGSPQGHERVEVGVCAKPRERFIVHETPAVLAAGRKGEGDAGGQGEREDRPGPDGAVGVPVGQMAEHGRGPSWVTALDVAGRDRLVLRVCIEGRDPGFESRAVLGWAAQPWPP